MNHVTAKTKLEPGSGGGVGAAAKAKLSSTAQLIGSLGPYQSFVRVRAPGRPWRRSRAVFLQEVS
jgi:hypothetical protein